MTMKLHELKAALAKIDDKDKDLDEREIHLVFDDQAWPLRGVSLSKNGYAVELSN